MSGTFGSLLKEGTQHLSGLEESILKNIEACKALSQCVSTSLGPNGMKKMIISQNDKIYVTKDAGTIVKELEIVHPAAKMIVLATDMLDKEAGDGTNLLVSFCGELLNEAEGLIKMGIHPSDIIVGYTKAGQKALEILSELVVKTVTDYRDEKVIATLLRSVISTKQSGYEDILSTLVARACIHVLPVKEGNFNVDNVRVVKVQGAGVADVRLIHGFAIDRDAEGSIKHVKNAVVAVFAQGIDSNKTETKGTVLLENADDLLNFTKSEENAMETIVKEIAGAGVNVIVSGGAVSELALHFLERYNIMVVRCPSKFQLRRICRSVRAIPLVRVGAPTAEELGKCESVSVEEIADLKVTVFDNKSSNVNSSSSVATLLVRGSTLSILEDLERSIDDAVNVFKGMIRNNTFVAGGGACEVELSRRLVQYSSTLTGLDQYSARAYASALEVVPRILATNAGMKSLVAISSLLAAHSAGRVNAGLDIRTGDICDTVEENIFDLFHTKYSALKIGLDAILTILRVDQIIMSKPAGGPKPRTGPQDDDPGFP